MNRKLTALLLASVMMLTVALAGCKDGTPAANTQSPAATYTQDPAAEGPTPDSASPNAESAAPTETAPSQAETGAPQPGTDTPQTATEVPTATTPAVQATPTPTLKPPATVPPVSYPVVSPRPSTAGLYAGPYSGTDGAYAGIDDLNRELPLYGDTTALRDRKVGVFYFLWQGNPNDNGQYEGGPYDNNEIVKKDPTAIQSESNWTRAGGGPRYAQHFWGKPLFGYYVGADAWVMRKHVQMLTDAGVDFIMFDTTNGFIYRSNVEKLIAIWYEYMEMGYDVPKLSFMTNSSSGSTMERIYREVYNNASLRAKYPDLDKLWYRWDGKPLIVGNASDSGLSAEARNYFRIKANQWPNEGRKDDGFPWMEFDRLLSGSAVYGLNGRKEVVNVSIAQHNSTVTMSLTAWYGGNDRTRSWHNGRNDTATNAILYGYNFAEQWEWAISVDPEMIFITGWNEWVAQRQNPRSNAPIIFVDCADPGTSRDAEPMDGLFGDNYYMQMVYYIRKYKGTAPRVDVGDNITIDMGGSFSQWNDSAITARYSDYTNDIVNRNERGFGSLRYRNETGRNDFAVIKAARDTENLYFYAETVRNISSQTGDNWMTLFLSSGVAGNAKWAGQFDFAVNLVKPSGDQAVISRYNANGTWTDAGTCRMKVEGNRIMISVPRSVLGVPDRSGQTVLDIRFKWADNYQRADGKLNLFSFYTDGDAAPYGRLSYVFSEKA